MLKKAAVYIRVSTDAQREEGYSIDAQKEMLAGYCASKGIKKFDYYIDGGFSGSNIERPEMQRLIEDVKKDKISCVLVYKLDRLSRSQKDTLYLIEDVFNPHGVDFVSLNESMDTSTPLGRLMLGILSAFAQLERENIKERTRMGMKERVKSGLWMGGGHTPFGYDYDRQQGILVPNKDAETVKRIYELYLKGYSTARIAQMTGLKYEKLAQQILTRKSNAGYISYKGVEYLGKHKPIISVETYEKAMQFMAERSKNRLTDACYLLTGLIVCGKCGAKMRYQKWGKIDCKIVCYSRDKSKRHLVKNPDCDNMMHWASDIEDIVLKDLFSFALKQKKGKKTDSEFKEVSDILEERYIQMQRQLGRLYNLYAESEDDVLLETINEQKNLLKSVRKQIETENKHKTMTKHIKDVKKTLTTLKETWQYMTKQEQKNIVRSCIEKIVITDENIDIYYKFSNFV